MIRGSDGLDYEDLNARLLGEPADTGRNSVLGPDSRQSEEYKKDYREAYDHYEHEGHDPHQCHYSARAQADLSQGQRIFRIREEAVRKAGRFFDDRMDALCYSVLAGNPLPKYTRPEFFGTITLYSGEPPASGPGGTGGPNPVQTPLATFCAAVEPPLRRWLGP